MPTSVRERQRLLKHYNLGPHVTIFLHMLIKNEHVTPQMVYEEIGLVEHRSLAYRLRGRAKDIPLRSQRYLGYWLDAEVRSDLQVKFVIPPMLDTSLCLTLTKPDAEKSTVILPSLASIPPES